MLKRILTSAAVLALFALPLAAQAAAPKPPAGDEMTMTGQVIDVNCNTAMGVSGPSHKQCAEACANKGVARSEEHTSELQSLAYLVCRLLLEKKKNDS